MCAINAIFVSSIVLTMKLLNLYLNSTALFLVRYFYILKWHFWDLSIDMGVFRGSWFLHNHEIPHPNQWGSMKNHTKNDVNSSERSDIVVFNRYLCHVSFLLTCYVCSTKIGEISDISKCFENFVSQTLGVLTRIYVAELRNESFSMEVRIILWIMSHYTAKTKKYGRAK